MAGFVGRAAELDVLSREFGRVGNGGRMVLVRGRRQIGKSRLLTEFLEGLDAPSIFFSATWGASPTSERRRFAQTLSRSGLDAGPIVPEQGFESWDLALRTIARTARRPQVVVLDELPYLLAGDASVEGQLQTVWDTALNQAPILLVLIGSDVSVMELLTTYGRPMYGRPTAELIVPPLSVADVSDLVQAPTAADAVDIYLTIGGYPNLALSWPPAQPVKDFLRDAVADPTSPLLVTGERSIGAEFPPNVQARSVLRAIGTGESTFTRLADRSGVPAPSLDRTLKVLAAKGVIERRRPLSSRPSRDSRYIIADPYLRFWMRFIEPGIDDILRGRGSLVTQRLDEQWTSYRGVAVEPLVRRSVERLLPDPRFGEASAVGGWWNRSGSVEVDLVGATAPNADRVEFIGSIKWRDRRAFSAADIGALADARGDVPGAATARLVGVSRSGFSTDALDLQLGPEELLDAWRGRPPLAS